MSTAGMHFFLVNFESETKVKKKKLEWRWCLPAICRFGSCFQLLPVRQTSTFLSFSSTNGGGDYLAAKCRACLSSKMKEVTLLLLWHASVRGRERDPNNLEFGLLTFWIGQVYNKHFSRPNAVQLVIVNRTRARVSF